MSEIAGVTHAMRWESVLLAGTPVRGALALPDRDALKPEILDRLAGVLAPQVANHRQ
jgi:hypothetical protein